MFYALMARNAQPHVVIAGAGFGGLAAARALAKAPVRITLVDRTNHHLFQPLLYQVAMAGLSPADIAAPIRAILRRQKNLTVLLSEATGIDLTRRTVLLSEGSILYDYLVLATGGRTSYFGHDAWEKYAPGLKDLDDAVEIRRRVLLAFEAAEKESEPERRRQLLTFVVVGGGPTGVELAGAIAELARYVLASDFRHIDPRQTRIILIEAGPRILPMFPEDLAAKAVRQLERLGVSVRTRAKVTAIDESGLHLAPERIAARTVLWAAGVQPTGLTRRLGAPLDPAGRVIIEPDLTLPGHPEAYAIGDMAVFLHQGGKPLPGVAPVAIQMGSHAARNIFRTLDGAPRVPFRYVDRGSMATIGRSAAIAQIGRLRLDGFVAWLAWLVVHLFSLIGFRNRVAVLLNWAWSYATYQRGARLITGRRLSLAPHRPVPPEEEAGAPRGEFLVR